MEAKVILVGPGSVGKTSIVLRFVEGRFDPEITSTIGAAFTRKTVTTKAGHTLKYNLWDTAGQERNQNCTRTTRWFTYFLL
jgi:small GTP-binding protein